MVKNNAVSVNDSEWLVCTYISSCSLVTSGSGESALILQNNLSGLPGTQRHTGGRKLSTFTHILTRLVMFFTQIFPIV